MSQQADRTMHALVAALAAIGVGRAGDTVDALASEVARSTEGDIDLIRTTIESMLKGPYAREHQDDVG